MQITQELTDLFRTVRTKLGAPVVPIQLSDEQLCDLLGVAMDDYTEKVQNWIIKSQWMNLYGKNMTSMDLAFGLSVRSLDMSKDFSYWFSKEVGLQQRGPWELKKDFFQIERGKQVYAIPAGREINKVLYVTPSTTRAALYGTAGVLDPGLAAGYGFFGNMGYGIGLNGFYVGSAYDTMLLATDLENKNQLLRGDLAYKVTAGPNGTRLIHLMSTPGSKTMFGGLAADDSWGWMKYHNWYVWYTYYDTNEGDMDECERQAELDKLRNGNNDILISPDQVPLSKLQYDHLNDATKAIIRRLLVAEAMITLALIRGTYSGKVNIPEAELQMDYGMYMDLGKSERETAMTELKERLEEMTPWKMMEYQANMVENLMKIKAKKPLGLYAR